jgi:hypothetical protein
MPNHPARRTFASSIAVWEYKSLSVLQGVGLHVSECVRMLNVMWLTTRDGCYGIFQLATDCYEIRAHDVEHLERVLELLCPQLEDHGIPHTDEGYRIQVDLEHLLELSVQLVAGIDYKAFAGFDAHLASCSQAAGSKALRSSNLADFEDLFAAQDVGYGLTGMGPQRPNQNN